MTEGARYRDKCSHNVNLYNVSIKNQVENSRSLPTAESDAVCDINTSSL